MRSMRDWLQALRGRADSALPPAAPLDPLPPAYAARFDPQRVTLAESVPETAELWSVVHQRLLPASRSQRGAVAVVTHNPELLPVLADQIARRAEAQDVAVRTVQPTSRWRSPEALLTALSEAQGQGKVVTRLEDMIAQLRDGPPTLVMMPMLHQAVLRAPGTTAMLTTLMRLMLATRGTVGWCLGAHATAWPRWERWVGIDGAVDVVQSAPGRDDAELCDLLWQRHQSGDRPLRICQDSAARNVRKVDGAEHEALRDWVRAARALSGGDPARIFRHWIAAAGLHGESGAIEVRLPRGPDWPAFGPLPPRQRYALIEIMVHDGLSLSELADLFVCAPDDMVKDLARLVAAGLVSRQGDHYAPPPAWSARLVRQLSALQAVE